MFNACQLGFAKGAKKVVILAVDCPEITVDILKLAFRALDKADAVIGPLSSGHYYLIGINKLTPDIFQEIEWNTSRVLEQTMERVKRTHLTFELLPELKNVPDDPGAARP